LDPESQVSPVPPSAAFSASRFAARDVLAPTDVYGLGFCKAFFFTVCFPVHPLLPSCLTITESISSFLACGLFRPARK
jgi:hypothetical protein